LTDHRGLEADQLDVTLSDHDRKLDIPPRGAKLHVWLGWSDTGLLDKGIYVADEIEHSGTPDILTIRARSADLRDSFSDRKERSWHGKKCGEIVETIAGENGLTPACSPDLAGEAVEHVDQTGESDASFLTRLAEQFDAIATVKSGQLLFFKIGRGKSLSGEDLPTVSLTRQSGDRHRFSVADREGCKAVRAWWHDKKTAKKKEVIVRAGDDDKKDKDKRKAKEKQKTAVEDGNIKTLRHIYASAKNAKRGAKAALDKAQRGVATFSLSLARGRPEIFPDLPATVSGFKPAMDGRAWLVTEVKHSLSNSGMTTDIELELKKEEEHEQDEAETPADAGDAE
jgi:phage protein D